MDLEISDIAQDDLDGMDQSQRMVFIKRFDKIAGMPPRRYHRKYCIENIGAGRLVYQITVEVNLIVVVRCFADHKDYDTWRDAER